MTAKGVVLARFEDVPDGGAIAVTINANTSIIIVRRGVRLFAYENRCAHADYPLQRADGHVSVQEGRYLVCAVHGASYAFETGACAGGPCNRKGLKRVAIEVKNGEVRTA